MRISDWSSDVCSSDLEAEQRHDALQGGFRVLHQGLVAQRHVVAPAQQPQRAQRGAPIMAGRLHHRRLAALDHRVDLAVRIAQRSEEHTSELQSLMRISYAVFCLKNKTNQATKPH